MKVFLLYKESIFLRWDDDQYLYYVRKKQQDDAPTIGIPHEHTLMNKDFDSPFIIRLFNASDSQCTGKDGTSVDMEYCPYSSLKLNLDPPDTIPIQPVIAEILHGIAAIHQLSIIFKDGKPENALIYSRCPTPLIRIGFFFFSSLYLLDPVVIS